MRFIENARGKGIQDTGLSSPKNEECLLEDGNIVGLEVLLLNAAESKPTVLVSYDDGRVVSIASDLAKHVLLDTSEVGHQLEFTAAAVRESTGKGLLEGRGDVTALMAGASSGSASPPLLLQIFRHKTGWRLALSAVHIRQLPGSGPVGVLSLMSCDLPRKRMGTATASYDFHAASGLLYQLVDGGLTIYDLSDTVPKIKTELGDKSKPICSFAHVTSFSILTCSTDTATLFETTFGSTLASGPLQNSTADYPASKKRKVTPKPRPFHVITAFSGLGVVAGISDNKLFTLHFDGSVADRTHETRLADVLGKCPMHKSHTAAEDGKDSRFTEWCAEVDGLIHEQDLEGLESLVAADKTLGRQRKTNAEERYDKTAYLALWPLPEPVDPSQLDRRRGVYLVSKILVHDTQARGLSIAFPSRKLLQWLALAGFLDPPTIAKAVGKRTALDEPLGFGPLMKAVGRIDPEFELMHDLLSLPVYWELDEVLQALCLLIRSLDVPVESDVGVKLAIPAPLGGAGSKGDDISMADGNEAVEFDTQSRAAECELDHALRTLAAGLEIRSSTLRAVLERLNVFPPESVVLSMRHAMARPEMLFFIQLLRIEMADGGWTSRYVDAPDEPPAGATESAESIPEGALVDWIPGDGQWVPSDRAIHAIGNLLNCAVDALGTGGWLVGLAGDMVGTAQLLDSLRAETSASLEGCFEAEALATLLGELRGQLEPAVADGGSSEGEGEGGGGAWLPLAGSERAEEPARDRDTRLERSRKKSRRVGKYAFERVRF